jgi:sugar phosphate permease
MALDFGGRTGGAMSSGLIDGVGYLGGALAGDTFARLAQAFGWASAFRLLGGVTAVSCLWAVALVWIQRRKAREVIPEPGR